MLPPSGQQTGNGLLCWQLPPQDISPPPTANLDRSNDRVYENVTGLVKAVIEMSSKIQPAPPEEYVPMVKVKGTRVSCQPAGRVPIARGRRMPSVMPDTKVCPSEDTAVAGGHVESEPPLHELLFLALTSRWECPGATQI